MITKLLIRLKFF